MHGDVYLSEDTYWGAFVGLFMDKYPQHLSVLPPQS